MNLPRRSFLAALGAGLIAPRLLAAQEKPILTGKGAHTYEWQRDWFKLPEGMTWGSTHGGVVFDAKGQVYVNSNTEQAVMIFDRDGKFVKSWGKDFKGGAHGMVIRKEGDREVIYLCHVGRNEVIKTTLDGDVLLTIGWPEKAGVYKAKTQYKPTNCAVAPNGDIYVGDGYGLSWIHHFKPDGEYVKSWGGKGKKDGEMQGPHGIWVDTRGEKPVVAVADRENNRIQIFDLEGKLLRVVTEELRRPSAFDQRGDDLLVVDLAGRITILDKDYKLVTHLGDQTDPAKRATNKLPKEQWQDGLFVSPHGARWDAEGNMVVEEWMGIGRVIRLKRVR